MRACLCLVEWMHPFEYGTCRRPVWSTCSSCRRSRRRSPSHPRQTSLPPPTLIKSASSCGPTDCNSLPFLSCPSTPTLKAPSCSSCQAQTESTTTTMTPAMIPFLCRTRRTSSGLRRRPLLSSCTMQKNQTHPNNTFPIENLWRKTAHSSPCPTCPRRGGRTCSISIQSVLATSPSKPPRLLNAVRVLDPNRHLTLFSM